MPGMAQEKSVDDIWAALKKDAAPKPKPKQVSVSDRDAKTRAAIPAAKPPTAEPKISKASSHKTNFDKLWFSFSNDLGGVGGVAGAATGLEYDLPLKRPASTPSAAKTEEPTQPVATKPVSTGGRAEAVGRTYEEVEAALQHDLQCVQDPTPTVRRKAIARIRGALLEAPQPPGEVVVEIAEQVVGKALLRRFDDSSEATREAAVTLLTTIVQRYPDATLALLPYAIPVIQERLEHVEGAQTMVEPVEELRLHLLKLLHLLVANADKAIIAYSGEVMDITRAGCADPFHEVLEETCGCILLFVGIVGLRLGKTGHQLVADVCPLVSHNRFRVRVAAVRTLTAIILTGSHEMILELVAHRDPNTIPIKAFYEGDTKVNFCARLATDRHAAVRVEFLTMLGEWLLKLPERRDHEQRLLPYVISLVNDEVDSISTRALEIMEALGAQYEADQKEDERVKEQRYYLPEEAQGLGWSQLEGQTPLYGSQIDQGKLDVAVGGSRGRVEVPMPPPFRSRPGLGARLLVQINFSRVAKTVCEELSSWITENRPRTARLLRTMLVYQEDHVNTQLHRILPAFQMVILEDPELRPYVEQCCEVIGCFVHPDQYLTLLLPFFEDDIAVDHSRTATTLALLANLIWGAGPKLATTGHLQAVMKVLSSDRISFSKDSSIRREALRLAQCVVASCGTAMLPVAPDMLAMLLRGQSLSMLLQGQDATTYRSSAFACMERLSVLTGFSSTAALVAAHRSRILPNPTLHIDHANLDQQLAVLSLILEGGQCMERMYPVIDSAPVPPPLPSPVAGDEMQGWSRVDTECVLACLQASPTSASSSMQTRLLASVERFVQTVPSEAMNATQAETLIASLAKLVRTAAEVTATKNTAALRFLRVLRWMLTRGLGGNDARSAWLFNALPLLEDFSRMEFSVAVRLEAVYTLHDLLLLPYGLSALPCGHAAGECQNDRPLDALTPAAADSVMVGATVSLLGRQPPWLLALLHRVDDADEVVQGAAIRALHALLRYLASNSSCDSPTAAYYRAAGSVEVAVFSALRFSADPSPGIQAALVELAECTAELQPELLSAALTDKRAAMAEGLPIVSAMKRLQLS